MNRNEDKGSWWDLTESKIGKQIRGIDFKVEGTQELWPRRPTPPDGPCCQN